MLVSQSASELGVNEPPPIVRLVRTLDGSFLNEVANHPTVRPWLGGSGALDLRPAIASPDNVALQCDGGGIVFARIAEMTYEAHSMFLPAWRGARAAAFLKQALRYVFTATDCFEILTRVPDGNVAADGFARLAGGREIYRLEHDLKMGGAAVSVRSLSLDVWRGRDAACLYEGRAFHEILEAAGAHDGHPEDEAHDRAVGASVLMFRRNNATKGVWAYNRWAALAGYEPVQITNASPVIVSMGSASVAMLDGRIEVVKCPAQ